MSFKDTFGKFLSFAWTYAKKHTFQFIMFAALIILGIVQVSQFTLIAANRHFSNANNHALEEYKQEMVVTLEQKEQMYLDTIENKGQELAGLLDEARMEVHSRIDILDSTIKPEKKRRMLIVKIRNAITENTNTRLTIRELNNIAIAVIDYSYQYNLSIAKVLAQIKQESDFVIKARSSARAQGLMQVIPETWEYIVLKEFERKYADPDNIYHNIRAGCFYMAEQLHKFDTYDQALMAYNWGPSKVRMWLAGEIPDEKIPEETTNYVKSINKHTQTFEKYGLE